MLAFRNAKRKFVKADSAKFNTTKASIGEISRPPIAGIIPRNAFKYGSVIELIVESTGMLQSRLGNQLSKTLTIRTKE